MIINSDKDIKSILNGICELTLPKLKWTHEAHFAAALAILSDPKYDAFNDMPHIIRSYNTATGVRNSDSEGYHHTITIASLYATEAILTEGHPSLITALRRILAAEYGQSNWMLKYWSKNLLFSANARKYWVDSDVNLLPFPIGQHR